MCSTLEVDKRRLFTLLKEEVFVSIYGKDVCEAKDVDFMKSVPFFSLIAGPVDAQKRGEIGQQASGFDLGVESFIFRLSLNRAHHDACSHKRVLVCNQGCKRKSAN
jgi:hypothetical protein